MDNASNILVQYGHENVGGYNLESSSLPQIASAIHERKKVANYTLLAPIQAWDSWYYFTIDPPLVWKHSSSLVEIDIQSVSCFFVMMFLCAATVYLSTRCLRRRIPSTTGFGNILWDFVASFFFEPFPSDFGILSVRLVLGLWLLGITIFCNEVNAVFKGKLSVKEYVGVDTKEDLDRLDYKLEWDKENVQTYISYKYGKETEVRRISLLLYLDAENRYDHVSKKAVLDVIYVQVIFMGETESRQFEYDARIHETIKNWALRLYEGTDGNFLERMYFEEFMPRHDSNGQLFTPYEMADLSVPFRLFGYGLSAAIGVKFVEIILAIYRNNNNKRPKRKPQFPEL